MTLNNFARASVLALALGGFALLSGEAVAADVSDNPSTKVFYGDLNLEHPEGAAALYRRLQTAATEVCRPVGRGDPFMMLKWQGCLNKALADAIAKVDSPTLTAYYRARNREHTVPVAVTAKN